MLRLVINKSYGAVCRMSNLARTSHVARLERRLLSGSAKLDDRPIHAASSSVSNRRHFQKISVNPKLLAHIQALGVSRDANSRAGRQRRRHHRPDYISLDTAPAPFDAKNFPVKLVGQMRSVDDAFPPNPLNIPEVAVIGRSNVGKSSLVNLLLYHSRQSKTKDTTLLYKRRRNQAPLSMPKGIKASMSDKPGATQQVSFYQLSSRHIGETNPVQTYHRVRRLCLVDLPGYGFAYANPETVKCMLAMQYHYLRYRGKALKRVLLLVDARHGLKTADERFLLDLQQRLQDVARPVESKRVQLPPIQLVLTKCDLVTSTDLARRVVQVQQQLSELLQRETSRLPILLVSARTHALHKSGGGIVELQRELAGLAVDIQDAKAEKTAPQKTQHIMKTLKHEATVR